MDEEIKDRSVIKEREREKRLRLGETKDFQVDLTYVFRRGKRKREKREKEEKIVDGDDDDDKCLFVC